MRICAISKLIFFLNIMNKAAHIDATASKSELFAQYSTSTSSQSINQSFSPQVIAKWVDIAQELRVLKNFSSLKAIVSGLQSNPVYRLRKAWAHLSRDKQETFAELARIFSEENNALAQRELLVREGTARFADTVGENDHHLQKVLQKHSENSRVSCNGQGQRKNSFEKDGKGLMFSLQHVF